MAGTLDLKKAVEDIVSSYQTKVESISSILDTTPLIFSDFHESILDTREEREKINTQLRDILARNEHLRKKDFDTMMQDILVTQNQHEREIRNLLKDYFNEQKSMAQSLKETLDNIKDSLAKGETGKTREFQNSIREILAKQDGRKNEITSNLKEFQEEQKTLASRLRDLLDKGRDLRIKDLKSMLREFKFQREKRLELQKRRKEEVGRRKEEVAKMLEGFKKARKDARSSPGKILPQTEDFGVRIDIDSQNKQNE